jgi:flavorubredoxin
VVEAISAILKDIDRDLPYGVFGSYGWSGEAVGAMQNRLKDAGFKSAFDPISLKFKPTDDMIEVLSTCR